MLIHLKFHYTAKLFLAGFLTIPAILMIIIELILTHWRFAWFDSEYLKYISIRHHLYERLQGIILDSLLDEASFTSDEQEIVVTFERTVGRETLETLAALYPQGTASVSQPQTRCEQHKVCRKDL